MNRDEFITQIKALFIQYQHNPDKLCKSNPDFFFALIKEYFRGTLANITSYEFEMIRDYCRENKVKPDFGYIPQYYQLKDIYDRYILSEKVNNKHREYDNLPYCSQCDDTGWVPFTVKYNNMDCDKVAYCDCPKGRRLKEGHKKSDPELNIPFYHEMSGV